MNNIRIATPPSVVEQAKIAQISNREALAKNRFETKIAEEVARRYTVKQQNDPLSINNIGGQLESSKKQEYKIRTKRRFPKRGFFLKPDSGYDAQNRLRFRTRDGLNAFSLPTDEPFLIDNGILKPKEGLVLKQAEYGTLSYIAATSTTTIENWTIEGFVYLESGPKATSTFTEIDPYTFKTSTTDSNVYLRIFSRSNFVSTSLHQTILLKRRIVKVPVTPNYQQRSLIPLSDIEMLEASLNWGIYRGLQNGTEQITDLTAGGRNFHLAITRTSQQSSLYFDGQLIDSLSLPSIQAGSAIEVFINATRNYWFEVLSFTPGNSIPSKSYLPYDFVPASCGWSQLRFTPDKILYSGESFTPPGVIVDLF